MRGVLRMARDDAEWYEEENAFFRDIARKISQLRDATSIIDTVKLLKVQFSKQLKSATFDSIISQLQTKRRSLAKEMFNQENILDEVAQDLKLAIPRLEERQLQIHRFEIIALGIKRVYDRGHAGYITAYETKDVHDLHEWRKRVKYLRYQIELISFVWPAYLQAYNEEFTQLGDILGCDHDLAVFTCYN